MINKITTILVSTMIGSFLYAGSYDLSNTGFLGLEVGSGTVNGEISNGSKHQGTNVEYGLRFGAQSDEWRSTFAFNYFNSDTDDQKVEKASFMVDYFFLGNNFDIPVKPFIGANLGVMKYESTRVDATDFFYGGQAGIIFTINENIDLDLSYRYSIVAAQEVNDFGNIVFGFNYLY